MSGPVHGELAYRSERWPTRFKFWLRWLRAGRPTDVPVVIKEGRLIACPHGRGLITGWWWDTTRMTASITIADLWDRYSAKYPIERVRHLQQCPTCRGAR